MYAYNQKTGTQAPQPVLLPPYRRQDVCAVVIRSTETPTMRSRLLALYLRGTKVHAKWVVKSVPREIVTVQVPAQPPAPTSATPSDVPSPTPDPKRRGSTPSGGAKGAVGAAVAVAPPVAAPIARPYCPKLPYDDDDTAESVSLVLPEFGDLANVVATRIAGVDGGTAALIATETYGVLVVGYLPGEQIPTEGATSAVPIRLASQLAASSVARSVGVYSIACGSRHALAVVDDDDAAYRGIRVSSVVGWGYTDTGALGTPGPSLTSVGPTEGLGKVPRRVQDLKQVGKPSLHEGAWPESFLPFVKLPDVDFASPPPSAVFAGRNMSFLVTPQGLFACGTLSTRSTFVQPTLVLDIPRPAVVGVVVLNRCAYALLRGNRLYRLGNHDGVDAEPHTGDEEQEHDEGVWSRFVEVTSRLLPNIPHDAALSKISAGAEHVIVTDTFHGRAYGWGLNSFGQLGESPAKVGLTVPCAIPLAQIPSQFASIHCWGMTTLVLDSRKEQIARFGN